jgi:hypothetical protein
MHRFANPARSSSLPLRIMAAVALAVLAAACGRSDTGSGSDAKASADLTQPLYCGAKEGLRLADEPAAAVPELRRVPADRIRMALGDDTPTICDLMRERAKPLTIFQFFSRKCYACMRWIDDVNASLETAGLLESVQTVVVMTDRIEDVSGEDAKRLKRDIAHKALWAHDAFHEMWAFFSPAPAGAEAAPAALPEVSPMLVAVDADTRGFFTADTALDGRTVVETANGLMQLGLDVPTADEVAPPPAAGGDDDE